MKTEALEIKAKIASNGPKLLLDYETVIRDFKPKDMHQIFLHC